MGSVKVTMAKIVRARVNNLVSCAPRWLRGDGQLDGMVEVRHRLAQSPATLFHLYRGHRPYIRLERQHPIGVYETGSAVSYLGFLGACIDISSFSLTEVLAVTSGATSNIYLVIFVEMHMILRSHSTI